MHVYRLTSVVPRIATALLAILVMCAGAAMAGGTRAAAAPSSMPVCPAASNVSSCDADDDAIPDTVERAVCGTATCSTGREDRDKDGIPDWVEFTACGATTCASPSKDSVGDGVPDFARRIVCGSATCSTGNTDMNANGVPKWASVVICGTTGCATGHEDYDADGVSDAVQLAACAIPLAGLASTGTSIAIGLIVALAAGLIGVGAYLARKRHLFSAALDAGSVA